MTTGDTIRRVQSFRTSNNDAIVDIATVWDLKANTHIILWKWIQSAFENPRYVLDGTERIFFMTDDSYE
ncbi:hypothetical protein CPC16_002483, partial [Podila verticillata]